MNLSKSRTAILAAAAVLALVAGSTSQVKAQGFGGGGGFQRPAVGSISAIDKADKTVTLTDDQSGDSTTVKVDASTNIITQETITAGSLKVGDHVRVQGVPTGIVAASIIEGDIPRLGGGGRGGFGGGPGGGGPGGPGGPGGNRPGGPGGPGGQPPTSVQGTVKSLNPLMVTIADGIAIQVSGSAKAKVSKVEKIGFSDLKIGDKVFAPGQAGDDGVVTATMLGVNLQMGGGRGGGFGGGGFGGGGFGGRGRRGGGGGFGGGPGGGGQGGDPNMAPGGGGDAGGGPPPPDDGNGPPPPQ